MKNFKRLLCFILVVLVLSILLLGCTPVSYEAPDASGYNYNDGLVALKFDDTHFKINNWLYLDDDFCVMNLIETADKFVVSSSQIEVLNICDINCNYDDFEVLIFDKFDEFIGSTRDYDFTNVLIEDMSDCYYYSGDMESVDFFVKVKAWLYDNSLTMAILRLPKDEAHIDIHKYDSELKETYNSMLYLGGSIDSDFFMTFNEEDDDIDFLDK